MSEKTKTVLGMVVLGLATVLVVCHSLFLAPEGQTLTAVKESNTIDNTEILNWYSDASLNDSDVSEQQKESKDASSCEEDFSCDVNLQ